MVFEVPLATQKVKPHQVTAMHLIAALAFIAVACITLLINNIEIKMPDGGNLQVGDTDIFDLLDGAATTVLLAGIAILFAGLFKNKWLTKPKNSKVFRIIEVGIAIAVAIFLLVKQFEIPAAIFGVLAAALAFAIFWENSKGQQLTVSVSEDGIKLPINSRRRNINWTETEKILLRHGTLTINCVDNRLYQWMTAPNDVNAEQFESFCAKHVEAAIPNRRSDDW